MHLLRSERLAALLLLVAASLGLIVANSPVGGAVASARDLVVGPSALHLDLSLGHWITDGLLAVFFLLAAIELRHELTHGALDTPRKALVPAIAAVGGVIVPALIYLAIATEPDLVGGWPVPTATDIAFALGVLALLGRGLPPRIRVLLLALAVIDDLIAIVLIAVFFTSSLAPVPLLLAVPVVLVFGWIARRSGPRRLLVPATIVLGLLAWGLVHASGVHATIAGVALGLVLPAGRGMRVRAALEPWTNIGILPLFAFTAALVVVPTLAPGEAPVLLLAIAIALPVGKLLGITAAAMLASRLLPPGERRSALPLVDVLVVAALGGIGFTVSLLMNELAFRGQDELVAEGTVGVLTGSVVAIVLGGTLTALRARAVRRRTSTR